MSAESSSSASQPKPEEFRRYRQALTGVYLLVGSFGSLLLLTSVAVELFFHHGAGGVEPTPADLLQCNAEVQRLLGGLVDESTNLQRDALLDETESDLAGHWEEFTRTWQRQWETVNKRCQFDELADTGDKAFDSMARVHARLPGLRHEYTELMKRFTDTQAGELAEMRAALESSRKLLEQRAETPPKPQ